jgi:hypothetical protein
MDYSSYILLIIYRRCICVMGYFYKTLLRCRFKCASCLPCHRTELLRVANSCFSDYLKPVNIKISVVKKTPLHIYTFYIWLAICRRNNPFKIYLNSGNHNLHVFLRLIDWLLKLALNTNHGKGDNWHI